MSFNRQHWTDPDAAELAYEQGRAEALAAWDRGDVPGSDDPRRPCSRTGRRGDGMSELSREQQVERLRVALASEGVLWAEDLAVNLAPTVAAMLDEARAESAAAVVRDVGAWLDEWDPEGGHLLDGILAHHANPATPGAPLSGECGVTQGTMTCHARKGHDGAHEDWASA